MEQEVKCDGIFFYKILVIYIRKKLSKMSTIINCVEIQVLVLRLPLILYNV